MQDRVTMADGQVFDVEYDWYSGGPAMADQPTIEITKIVDKSNNQIIEEEALEAQHPDVHGELIDKLWDIISGPYDDGEDDEPDSEFDLEDRE